MEPPPPGSRPSTVPTAEPIACGLASRRIIGKEGRRRRTDCFSFSVSPTSPDCWSSSLTANRPTITRIGFTPDSNSGMPKEKRLTPETGSEPTVAIISPTIAAASAFSRDPPASEAMMLRPRTPTAK